MLFLQPFDPLPVDRSQPGIWRYRHTFGLSPNSEPVSLGEGNTPLLWGDVFGRKVAFKCEFLNPTGSFKDRGSSLIAAWLRERGVKLAVEDSSGNAGASLAAYTTRVVIKTRVFVPEFASGPKLGQIEALGAELVRITGSRADVAEAVKEVAEEGEVYASHAYLPFNLPGYATAAYEIFEQLGNLMPGGIVIPVGQGGLLLGLIRGFEALRIANESIIITPKVVAVQARECAPLWAKFMDCITDEGVVAENQTLAEGVQVRYPLRADAVLSAVVASHGTICVANENEILTNREALAHLGFYVEPTSAIVWSGLKQMIKKLPDPVVVILTGSGYKYE
jgi:threonine synthase